MPNVTFKIKSQNVTWVENPVTHKQRQRLHGHQGAVVWLTGLSSSGKSMLAIALEKELFKRGISSFILDGDNIRQGLNSNLGFSEEDRIENMRRVGEVAKLFAEAGLIVITAFISPYASSREFVRSRVGKNFIEVFVNCPLNVCEKRDPKGLYKKARQGKIKQFTGISAPYEIPERPELMLRTDLLSTKQAAEKILNYLNDRKIIQLKKKKK